MIITADDYITSETAKVSVTVTYAMMDADQDPRAEVMKAADEVSKAAWYVNGVHRAEDNSGIETVTYSLTVRVPEKEINSLKKKVKAVSRAGLKMQITGTDYSPTTAQFEEGKKAIRKKIYEKVNDELKILNEIVIEGDERWVVGDVNFLNNQPLMTKNSRGITASAMYESFNSAAEDEESDGVTQKLTMTANVTFARKIYSRL
jgi:hypothetical protein